MRYLIAFQLNETTYEVVDETDQEKDAEFLEYEYRNAFGCDVITVEDNR
jgi:hypothetical protein